MKKARGHIDRRHHLLFIDESDATKEDKNAYETDPISSGMILMNFKRDKLDCEKIPGIASIYQSRGSKDSPPNTVYFRNHPCFCEQCRKFNWADCTHLEEAGRWVAKTTVETTVQEGVVLQGGV